MRALAISLFASMAFCAWAKEYVVLSGKDLHPKKITDLKRIVYKTTKEDLRKLLRDFVKHSSPNRYVGSEGHADARKWIESRVVMFDREQKGKFYDQAFLPDVDFGMSLYYKDFEREVKSKFKSSHPEYKRWDAFTQSMITHLKGLAKVKGHNLVWEKKGSTHPKDILIIGAHYDTIVYDKEKLQIRPEVPTQGANDNGAAVAVLLKFIEYLAQLPLKKTVRVVFFDYEEMAFLGSRHYVKVLKKELASTPSKNFQGYINLEMIGHDTKALDKEKKYGNMKLYIRKSKEAGHEQDSVLASWLQAVGSKMRTNVKFEINANSWNASDHLPFWESGLPALSFTQNWDSDHNEKSYHTESDVVETLNMRTLIGNFRFILGGLLSKALEIDS